jgi:hypothetical protein
MYHSNPAFFIPVRFAFRQNCSQSIIRRVNINKRALPKFKAWDFSLPDEIFYDICGKIYRFCKLRNADKFHILTPLRGDLLSIRFALFCTTDLNEIL